jgi:hypothetical protein
MATATAMNNSPTQQEIRNTFAEGGREGIEISAPISEAEKEGLQLEINDFFQEEEKADQETSPIANELAGVI